MRRAGWPPFAVRSPRRSTRREDSSRSSVPGRGGTQRGRFTPPSFQVDDLVRLGRSAQRRRRIAAAAAVAAAVAVIVAVTISSLRPGLLGQRHDPAITPVPTATAVLNPTPTALNPTPTATVDPTAPTSAGGIGYLLTGNTILTASGKLVTIPAPRGLIAHQAVRVSGGWVVSLWPPGTAGPADIRFLAETGAMRSFQPELVGAPNGFAADGSRMAARIGPDIYVYELPSLTVRHRIEDVRRTVGDGHVDRIWLRGDLLVVNFLLLGDSGPGFSGVVNGICRPVRRPRCPMSISTMFPQTARWPRWGSG